MLNKVFESIKIGRIEIKNRFVVPPMVVNFANEDGTASAIVEKFGDAALRGKKAGFDGIEVHGSHGYLINQFMSPFSNKRTDQ